MYYLRKITRGKWPKERLIAQATLETIPADTVVTELKTDNNKLSLWKVENEDDLRDAFIALCSSSSSIGTIWFAKIAPEDIETLELDEEDGDTPTIGINHKHCNIVGLNYLTMGNVLLSVINSLQNERVVKKTKGEMKRLMVDAYIEDKLDYENLEPSLKEEIRKSIDN